MTGSESSSWRVYVAAPRKGSREVHWHLRAKRRLPDGTEQEHRESSGTLDRRRAEELARVHEADLNRGRTPGAAWSVLDAVEARAQSLEGEGRAEAAERLRFAVRRLGAFGAVTDAELDRAALLRARDALLAQDLGARTIRNYVGWTAAAWRWAHERGHVRVPWPTVKALPRRPTLKRPFTDAEVADVLAWVESYLGGRWGPLFHLLADTGRRIGELVRLRGRDVRREEGVIAIGRTKTGAVATVPVPRETMAMLPAVEPDAFLWPARARGAVPAGAHHVSRSGVRGVLRRALRAVGVADADRLDTHSLRRAFVASCERAGVPTDVGRRVTGHESRQMWDTYQAGAVNDDLHGVVERVRARSLRSSASPVPPPAAPAGVSAEALNPHGGKGSRGPAAEPVLNPRHWP